MEQTRLLRIDEVATALGIAQVTVRKWVRQGRIASIKLSRARRIPATELERLVQEGLPER